MEAIGETNPVPYATEMPVSDFMKYWIQLVKTSSWKIFKILLQPDIENKRLHCYEYLGLLRPLSGHGWA